MLKIIYLQNKVYFYFCLSQIKNIMKRFFDVTSSAFGLIILSPIFLIIAICIKLNSKRSVFYKQIRAGKNAILWV